MWRQIERVLWEENRNLSTSRGGLVFEQSPLYEPDAAARSVEDDDSRDNDDTTRMVSALNGDQVLQTHFENAHVKTKPGGHPVGDPVLGSKIESIVDDVTMCLWANRASQLQRIAYYMSKFWRRMVNGEMKVQLNDGKCELIPFGKFAQAALRGCLEEGIRRTCAGTA